MFILLLPALLTFMTVTSAEVKVQSNLVGLRDRSLDGKVSSQHLLFEADVSTMLTCASTCQKYDCCAAFSTSPIDPLSKKVTCRGHDSRSISQSTTVDVPGSKTYFMTDRPSGSTWLERPCTGDSHCPDTVTNVTCFADAGQCLCQPGYYYSHCRDDCVADCAPQDLQTTFVKYPKHGLKGLNIVQLTNCTTIEEARQHCLNFSNCLSFDMQPERNTCFPQKATALTPGAIFEIFTYTPTDYYQRTCH